MAAYVLTHQLIALLIPVRRYMDLCECYMLSAIIYYKMKNMEGMCEELSKAIALAKKVWLYQTACGHRQLYGTNAGNLSERI